MQVSFLTTVKRRPIVWLQANALLRRFGPYSSLSATELQTDDSSRRILPSEVAQHPNLARLPRLSRVAIVLRHPILAQCLGLTTLVCGVLAFPAFSAGRQTIIVII